MSCLYCKLFLLTYFRAFSESSGSITLSPANEKLSVRRMVSLIRQIGGDAEGETDGQQRRLRRMLEETLTKNMHLQVSINCCISFSEI